MTLPTLETAEIEARDSWTLKDAIRDWGLPIVAQCGGARACGTCHVHIAKQWVDRIPRPHAEEIELVSASESYVAESSRLSCQITCAPELDGLRVVLQIESYDG